MYFNNMYYFVNQLQISQIASVISAGNECVEQ